MIKMYGEIINILKYINIYIGIVISANESGK